MEIETQRENGVCWTDNHWGKLRRWVTGAIMTLLLTLFTTLTPAHAAVESVNTSSYRIGLNECIDATRCTDEIFTYDSAVTWCASYFTNFPRSGYATNTVTKLVYNFTEAAGGAFERHWYICGFYINGRDASGGVARAAYFISDATCPNPFFGPAYVFNPQNRRCERTLPDCPANSSYSNVNPFQQCTCHTGYKFDAAGTSCVPVVPPVTCPIDPLPKFPLSTDDACTKSLEEGAGTDVKKACPDITDEMKKGAQCLADKIKALKMPGVDHNKQSGNIRTKAYQQHLVDILKSSTDIENLTDIQKQSCAAEIADVDAHLKHHGKITTPSRRGSEAPHVLGNAIDIPEAVVEALKARVSDTTFITPSYCLFCIPPIPVYIGDVEDYVNSSLVNPPACKLRWGGLFVDKNGKPIPDRVHFQLR